MAHSSFTLLTHTAREHTAHATKNKQTHAHSLTETRTISDIATYVGHAKQPVGRGKLQRVNPFGLTLNP